LVVALYFVATSSVFFKRVVLPRTGRALNANLSVADAEISLFSHLVLRDLKVTPTGGEPVFTAASVTARYDLFAILRGRIQVQELTIVAPRLTLIENADGTSNLDPLLKHAAAAPAPPVPHHAVPGKPSSPPALDIKTVRIDNATIRYVQNLPGAEQQTLELSHLNFNARDVRNGATGKVTWSAGVALDRTGPVAVSNAQMQASVNGQFTFDLASDLIPRAVTGDAAVKVDQAAGGLAELTALAVQLDCNISPAEIKTLALQFTRAGVALGAVRVNGPFDIAKTEGRLTVEVTSLDRQLLNLVGHTAGIDFGTTTINTSNEVELAQGGLVITAAGQVNVVRMQVTRQGQTSPTINLRCDYEMTVDRAAQSLSLRTLNLAGTQNDRPLVRAELTNPMMIAWGGANTAVGDAALTLEVSGLNLAEWRALAGDSVPAGIANGNLKLRSHNAGKELTVDLTGQVDQLSVRAGKDQSPPIDVQLQAHATGTNMSQFHVTDCRLELLQNKQSVVTISGTGAFDRASRDASAQLSVQAAFDRLSDWAATWLPTLREYSPVGVGNVKLNAQSHGGTKSVNVQLDGQLQQLSAQIGQKRLVPIDVKLAAQVAGAELRQFSLSECRLALAEHGQPVVTLSSTGTVNRVTPGVDLQIAVEVTLDRLAALLPQTNLVCSAGTLTVTGHITKESVVGRCELAGFTGGYGPYRLGDFGTTLALDLAMKGRQVMVRNASGQLRHGTTAGGQFDVSGNCDLDQKAGRVDAKLTGFTERDLRPFLQPSLGDKQLVSVSFDSTANAGVDAKGNCAVKADVHLANLVVRDRENRLPPTPLEARLAVEASASNRVATIRQCQLKLAPTSRAKNELQLTGTVDYAKTNAITGNVQLAAEALDVTPYYDLLAGGNPSAETAKGPVAQAEVQAAPAASAEQKEPAAVTWPVRDFICQLSVGQCYLRQVVVKDLRASAHVDGGHIMITPCQLTLNGAPVSATVDLDLGVPGYKYSCTFNADKVPLQPLADSFSPTYSAKARGDLIASIQVQGAGITGKNLRQNLTGRASLSFTNADIAIVGPKVKAVLTPIAFVLGAPELLNSPLDYIHADLSAGDGKIEVQKFLAHSAAFVAESQGRIPIADSLAQSPLNQPIEIALSRDLAGKLQFANLRIDNGYAKLPTFVHLTGTLGEPSAKIDKAVLVGLTASGAAGLVGGRVGGLLQGISSILTGEQPGTATNAPANEAPAPFNPFDLLRKRH
jgi:hypothetical protein